MKNSKSPKNHCAEHLQLAMQVAGKSPTEILALLPDKRILLAEHYLEISLGDVSLSGILNTRSILEKVRLFTDTNAEILYYVEYFLQNFTYSSTMNAWLYKGFIFRLELKFEWCISVEKIKSLS